MNDCAAHHTAVTILEVGKIGTLRPAPRVQGTLFGQRKGLSYFLERDCVLDDGYPS